MPDPAPVPSSSERWVLVARLLRPQGRRGEILAEPHTDLSEVFRKDRQFRLASDEAAALSAPWVTLENCWQPHGRNAGRLVLKLTGTNSISEAEALEGKELFLLESELPALDVDTYLVRDLVGCAVFDGEHCLGNVVEIEFPVAADRRTRLADAADLLVVTPLAALPEAEPVLVPFVKAWLQDVDLAGRRITMQLPAGLFE